MREYFSMTRATNSRRGNARQILWLRNKFNGMFGVTEKRDCANSHDGENYDCVDEELVCVQLFDICKKHG
jgi:hypothetical protein